MTHRKILSKEASSLQVACLPVPCLPVPCLLVPCLLAPALCFLVACSGSGGGAPTAGSAPLPAEEEQGAQALRMLPGRAGHPNYELHWTLAPASEQKAIAFRAYVSIGSLLPRGHRDSLSLGATFGGLRSLPVTLEADSGLNFLAIDTLWEDGSISELSRALVVDTTQRLVFATDEAVTRRQLWLHTPRSHETVVLSADFAGSAWAEDGSGVAFINGSNKSLLFKPVPGRPAELAQNPLLQQPPTSPPAEVEVLAFKFSPDAKTGYLAVANDLVSLFVRDGAKDPLRVSKAPQGHGHVEDFAWSPNGDKLIYLQTAGTVGTNLFLVGVEGGTPTQINPALLPHEFVGAAAFSADGRRVAYYLRDVGNQQYSSLYIHDLDPMGSGFSGLVSNSLLPARPDGRMPMAWSPAGDALAYLARPRPSEAVALYKQRVLGQAPLLLAQLIDATGDLLGLAFSPDGSQLALLVKGKEGSLIDLFLASAKPSGGLPVGAQISPGETVVDFAWSPDGLHVAMHAVDTLSSMESIYRFDVWQGPLFGDRRSLASAPEIGGLAWSPDGSKLAFSASGLSGGSSRMELYLVPASGGPRTAVSEPVIHRGPVSSFEWNAYAAKASSRVQARLEIQTGNNK